MSAEEIAALPYRRGVGVVLCNAQGLVFVGQRIDSYSPAWQMPQGGIDPGEDPQDTALRELWEETGVTSDLVTIEAETSKWLRYDLPHDIVPRIWKGRFRGQEQKWFLARFSGRDDQVQIATEHPEFSQWRWLAASELVENIVPFKRDLYVDILAEFAEPLGL
ncbi:MAG: RNA pyrophosphohydrolase [Mangrovicoccus sp.]|nr:RNA pyrophosphohydrolase [Mangrovicoccus sp.]